MGRYVDGFLIPVKKKNLKAYKKMALMGRKLWMKYGALDFYECVGSKLENGSPIPFTKLCKLKSDETLIFSFIVYKSKAHRNQVTAKVMKDPQMQADPGEAGMPFDMKRFTSGEFNVIVQA